MNSEYAKKSKNKIKNKNNTQKFGNVETRRQSVKILNSPKIKARVGKEMALSTPE
jgi:hypothetical protein